MTTFDKNKDLILDALIKLYLDVKVRNPEEVENYTDKKLEEERSSLLKIDILTIIGYIRSSFEILLTIKEDEGNTVRKIESENTNFDSELTYNDQLQKLEAESRMHINVNLKIKSQLEQQMKLQIDALEETLNADEKNINELKSKIEVMFF